MKMFSKNTRFSILNSFDDAFYDLIIIGGGIKGSSLLLEAVSRGLKTLLLTDEDFTSNSDSSIQNPIQSGFPYLKKRDYSQISEIGKENANLYKRATHLVYNQKVLMPFYQGQLGRKTVNKLKSNLYDRLRKVNNPYYKSHFITKEKLGDNLLDLPDAHLEGAFAYYEHRLNTNRIVIETIKTAIDNEAQALSYCQVTKVEAVLDASQFVIHFTDQIENNTHQVKSKYVINTQEDKLSLLGDEVIRYSKVQFSENQIFIDRSNLNLTVPVYIPVNSDNSLFLIPIDSVINIVETRYVDKYDTQIKDKQNRVESILDFVNSYFSKNLGLEDVLLSKTNRGYLYYKNSHKPLVIKHSNCSLSVLGGVFVNHRSIADKVINEICKSTFEQFSLKTSNLKLIGANFKQENIEDYLVAEYAHQRFLEVFPLGAEKEEIYKLIYRYGTEIETIIEKVFTLPRQTNKSLLWLEAEIWYSVNYEMIINLSNFLKNRSEQSYFECLNNNEVLQNIAQLMAKYLDWSEEEMQEQLDLCFN